MKTMLPAVAAVLFLLAGCATAPRYQKMLVVGDSLTACAPLPALGWNHDWGLAATAAKTTSSTGSMGSSRNTPPLSGSPSTASCIRTK